MLNIKKAITVSEIFNNLISLNLIIIFCLLNNLYAQIEGDFPPEREFDPRHPFTSFKGRPLDLRERGVSPSDISKDVELVGATGGGTLMFSRIMNALRNSLLRKELTRDYISKRK